jgi:error-prone DNA polymerase
MHSRGLSPQFARQVFQQIRGFGEYGFPESHAASFALLVYVSAWLKHYHPAAFTASLVNSQPMGFYSVAQLVRDAREHGVEVLGVDVNWSESDCTLETDPGGNPTRLRLGLRIILGLPTGVRQAILKARRDGLFQSQHDFQQRTGLGRAMIMKLATAGAFASLQQDRRHALWESLAQQHRARELPLFDSLPASGAPAVPLPPMPAAEEVATDYQSTGLSLHAHPVSFCREQLEQLGITPANQLSQLPDNQHVRVAGLVLLRQRPSTARGITFVTLEDETGVINLVIHQQTWNRFYTLARRSHAWIAEGRIESRDSVIHLVVERIADLSEKISVQVPSRDFK